MSEWDPDCYDILLREEAFAAVDEWQKYSRQEKINPVLMGPDLNLLRDMISYCYDDHHIEQPSRISACIYYLHEKLWKGLGIRWNVIKESRHLTDEEILLAHSPNYLHDFKLMEAGLPWVDDSTEEKSRSRSNCLPNLFGVNPEYSWSSVGPSIARAARASGGTILQLAQEILIERRAQYGVGIVRPPGHHCSTDQSSGNGVVNNIAITAKWINRQLGLKVMIIDWDVHYSGGTTEILRGGKSLLDELIDGDVDQGIHLIDIFGARGQEIRQLCRNKYGRNWNLFEYAENACFINVNLVPTMKGESEGGSKNKKDKTIGDDEYLSDVVWNEITRQATIFNPDVLLISCGFDAAAGDDEGFGISERGYYQLTQLCRNMMKEKPIIIALEGGYKPEIIGNCLTAVVSALHNP